MSKEWTFVGDIVGAATCQIVEDGTGEWSFANGHIVEGQLVALAVLPDSEMGYVDVIAY